MSCERVQALMGLGDELDRAEQMLLRRHLQDCPACRAAAIQEEQVRAYLARLPELPVPARLQTRLLAIPEAVAATGPLASLPALGRIPFLAAVALLGLLGLWLGLRLRSSDAGPFGPAPFVVPSSGTPTHPDARVVQLRPQATGQAATEVATTVAPIRPSVPDPAALRSAPSPTRRVPGSRQGVGRPPNINAGGAGDEMTGGPGPAEGKPTAPPIDEASGDPPEPRRGREPATALPGATHAPMPTAAPTDLPATSQPVAAACLTARAEVFLDLAGEGPRSCPGCDGRFDDADRAAAAAMGLRLPGASLSWVDAEGQGEEGLLFESDGVLARRDGLRICGSLPITVTLSIGLPEDGSLASCPDSPGKQQRLGPEDDGAVLRWGIGVAECPNPTATPPTLEAGTPEPPALLP